MVEAFLKVCWDLKLDGDAVAREAAAEQIIELVQRGELDPERIRERVVLEANRNAHIVTAFQRRLALQPTSSGGAGRKSG